jgi:transposase
VRPRHHRRQPESAHQTVNRQRKGRAGGRAVGYDTEQDENRNVVERLFNRMKHWRGLASRYDKHAVNGRGGAVLLPSSTGLKRS